MNLKDIQNLVYIEYVKNGYSERWTQEYFKSHPIEFELLIDLAEVGLINTEVSELLEDIRDNNIEKYGEESADIIIRVMNWCKRKGIDLETHIIKKHEKNLTRGELHGKAI